MRTRKRPGCRSSPKHEGKKAVGFLLPWVCPKTCNRSTRSHSSACAFTRRTRPTSWRGWECCWSRLCCWAGNLTCYAISPKAVRQTGQGTIQPGKNADGVVVLSGGRCICLHWPNHQGSQQSDGDRSDVDWNQRG